VVGITDVPKPNNVPNRLNILSFILYF